MDTNIDIDIDMDTVVSIVAANRIFSLETLLNAKGPDYGPRGY